MMDFANTNIGSILNIISAIMAVGALSVVVFLTLIDFGPIWSERIRKRLGK